MHRLLLLSRMQSWRRDGRREKGPKRSSGPTLRRPGKQSGQHSPTASPMMTSLWWPRRPSHPSTHAMPSQPSPLSPTLILVPTPSTTATIAPTCVCKPHWRWMVDLEWRGLALVLAVSTWCLPLFLLGISPLAGPINHLALPLLGRHPVLSTSLVPTSGPNVSESEMKCVTQSGGTVQGTACCWAPKTLLPPC